jgi:hypothetical protein
MKERLQLTTKQPGNEAGRRAGGCQSGIHLSQLTRRRSAMARQALATTQDWIIARRARARLRPADGTSAVAALRRDKTAQQPDFTVVNSGGKSFQLAFCCCCGWSGTTQPRSGDYRAASECN